MLSATRAEREWNMTVKEYVEKLKVTQITFIKARARKDAYSPFYHAEYQTTPMFYRDEVKREGILSDYIILNDRQAAIDWLSGANWNNAIKSGWAQCLLVINPSDFALLISSEEQRESMIKHIDKKLSLPV